MNRPRFDPELFSHGRLLYRFEGSDACRFSPKLGMALLGHLAQEYPGAALWDPFCGSGLIPCLARVFWADYFREIIASDISPLAVDCAAMNLGFWDDEKALDRRRRELRGMQGLNPRSGPRWSQVEAYFEEVLADLGRLAPFRVLLASAMSLPKMVDGPLVFVSDLPYNRVSSLVGDVNPLEALFRRYPQAAGVFVSSAETHYEDVPLQNFSIQVRPVRGNRKRIEVRRS